MPNQRIPHQFKFAVSLLLLMGPLGMFSNAMAQGDYPTQADAIQNYLDAIGGQDALDAVETASLKAKHVDQVQENEYTVTHLVSGKKWISRDSNGAVSGSDGEQQFSEVGGKMKWRKLSRYPYSPTRPILFARHVVNFPGKLKHVGEAEINGKTVFRFKVTPPTPVARDRVETFPLEMFFEEESGLLVQYKTEYSTVQLLDYREIDGIKLPYRIKKFGKVADLTFDFDIQVDEIELNLELEEGLIPTKD